MLTLPLTPLPLLPPLAGIAVVMAACGLLLGTVAWWRKRSQPPAELTRKAVHVGMGLIALTLPWVFDRTWPVLVLCGGLAAAFLALKIFARQSPLGAAMHDVNRSSRGRSLLRRERRPSCGCWPRVTGCCSWCRCWCSRWATPWPRSWACATARSVSTDARRARAWKARWRSSSSRS